MRYAHAWVFAAAALIAACGGNTTTAPSTFLDSANGRLHAQDVSNSSGGTFRTLNDDPCGDTTYVGPVRPISVHGTTFNISWLGSDNPVRGYEVQWQLDVNNVYVDSGSTVVTLPEAEIHVRTEGTYRFRVRGLFCNEQVGGWTDWVVKGTDDTEDHTPIIPPQICLTSVSGCPPPPPGCGNDCPPPPCVIDCPPPPCTEHCGGDDGDHGGHDGDDDGHGDHGGGDHNPPPPPPFAQYLLCHVEFHQGHGGRHPVPDSYTEQQKTIHSQGEANGHANHEFDYVGSCDNRYNVS